MNENSYISCLVAGHSKSWPRIDGSIREHDAAQSQAKTAIYEIGSVDGIDKQLIIELFTEDVTALTNRKVDGEAFSERLVF